MALFVISVSQLTEYIAEKLEKDDFLSQVAVEGELSNCKFSQGHLFFTLKDEKAELKGIMYQRRASALPFIPKDGQKVIVFGRISVYTTRGIYQLYADHIEPQGIGTLYLKHEQTKEKLVAKGYFDPARKRPLPKYPQKIGVVTSKTGAAIRDILITIKSRWPKAFLYLVPVVVQGEEAPGQIVKALNLLNRYNLCEVIILARGGGSFEELAPFSEEIVADAIYSSKIPVVTGIGHETDTSIADLVADLRAPTPTGAAVKATPNLLEISTFLKNSRTRIINAVNEVWQRETKSLNYNEQRLNRAYTKLFADKSRDTAEIFEKLLQTYKSFIKNEQNHLNLFGEKLQLLSPKVKKRQQEEKLGLLKSRLFSKTKDLFNNYNKDLSQQKYQLLVAYKNLLTNKKFNLISQQEKLQLLNPLNVLKRGYAVVFDAEGRVVTSIHSLSAEFNIKFADGEALAKTLKKNIIKDDENNDL